MVDRDFQRKTNALVQEHVGTSHIYDPDDVFPIDSETIDLIQRRKSGDNTKVINLIKSKPKEASTVSPFSSSEPCLMQRSKTPRTSAAE